MFNRFVIADPELCLGCYMCMVTCAQVHEEQGLQPFPRLFVVSTSVATMPIQCRHCEEPFCKEVCPVKAIEIKDQSVQLNEEICIGCAKCAFACPFGAIEIEKRIVNKGKEIKYKKVAIKCDLCYFRKNGPACVEICPTGALKEIKNDEIEKLIELKRVTIKESKSKKRKKLETLNKTKRIANIKNVVKLFKKFK